MATLTDNDRKLIAMSWQCFKSTPEVDYAKLQELGGYKTPASANACYLAVKKKMVSSTHVKLTEGDRKILIIAWQCFKSQPQIDYKKLQEMGNYKSTASANACYLTAKKKLLGDGIGAAGPKKGAGSAARKRKSPDTSSEETPKKKKGGKRSTVKAEDDGAHAKTEEGGEASPSPAQPIKTEADAKGTADAHLLHTAHELLKQHGQAAAPGSGDEVS